MGRSDLDRRLAALEQQLDPDAHRIVVVRCRHTPADRGPDGRCTRCPPADIIVRRSYGQGMPDAPQ